MSPVLEVLPIDHAIALAGFRIRVVMPVDDVAYYGEALLGYAEQHAVLGKRSVELIERKIAAAVDALFEGWVIEHHCKPLASPLG